MIKLEIEKRLKEALQPTQLEVIDESHLHAGHVGAKPTGNTHFRLKITSIRFNDLKPVTRHQLVYSILSDLMNNPIHALAMELKGG
jgi:BolA protein